jgi:hypothetical protein
MFRNKTKDRRWYYFRLVSDNISNIFGSVNNCLRNYYRSSDTASLRQQGTPDHREQHSHHQTLLHPVCRQREHRVQRAVD